jgi:uncharacterized protein (DUF2249 family)
MSEAVILPVLAADTQILDVRPLLEAGKDPFGEIMRTLGTLKAGQGLAIRANFQATPLMGVFGAKGYVGVVHRLAEDDWILDFQPAAAGAAAPRPAAPGIASSLDSDGALDVRNLEPPEPLVRIIAACRTLAPGATLKVLHERRPSLLYPKLDELGFTHRTEELAEDVFHIYVTRPMGKEG